MEGISFLSFQVVSFEKPAFGFRGDLLPVAVNAYVELAMGDKVRENDLGQGKGGGGGHG